MNLTRLLLLSCMAMLSCAADSGNYYVCYDADRHKSMLFAWDARGVYQEHNRFSFARRERGELTAQHDGGDYTITDTADKIVLSYLQDTVYTLVKRPSGEFARYDSDTIFADIYAVGHAIIYSAIIPNMYIHSFDKRNKSLTLTYRRMSAARPPDPRTGRLRAYKKKHWVEKGAKYTSGEIMGALTEKEIKQAFFANEKEESSWSYPHCEKKLSFMGRFLQWLKFLDFAW